MATQTSVPARARRIVQIWIDAFSEHDLLTYASAIAFQVLKSLIPLTLLGVAVLGAVNRHDVWTRHVAPALEKRFDRPVYRAIDFAVEKIFAHNSAPLLVFGALLTIWYVSGGVRAIMGGINRIYDASDERPFWIRWPISIGLAVCIVSGLVGAAFLVEIVPTPHGAAEIPVKAVRWLGAVAVLTVAAGLVVRLGPVERRPKKWVSAGAALVVTTWIVTSVVFRWYVETFANFKTAVGQLTVFIVVMLYAYVSSIVFLVGVEVDELLRADATSGERGILDVIRRG